MNWQPHWKKGDTIRHILTGDALQVLHIYNLGANSSATLVIDLTNRNNPLPLMVLLQRDYDHWVPDHDMETKITNNNEVVEWKYNHVEIK